MTKKATSLEPKDWEWARPLQDLFTQNNKGDQGVESVRFAFVERAHYVAELGRKNADYVYHFYPIDAISVRVDFSDKLGDAFIEVFKIKDRLSSRLDNFFACQTEGCAFKGRPEDLEVKVGGTTHWYFCPDCKQSNLKQVIYAWAVRAAGFAQNPMTDELAVRVFDELDKLLEKDNGTQ